MADSKRADRICSYCGKKFNYPYLLKRHLNGKRKCVPSFAGKTEGDEDKPYECRYCGTRFMDETHMHRHIRDTCKIAPNERNGTDGLDRLYDLVLAQRDTDETRIASLEGVVETLSARLVNTDIGLGMNANVVNIQGDNNQVQQTDARTVVNINFFGAEGTNHITKKQIRAVLDRSMENVTLPLAAQNAIIETAMIVYSDPEHPENLTCFLPNKKTDDALLYTDRGWDIQPVSIIVPRMAVKSLDALFNKQPYEEDADLYTNVMVELRDNEKKYVSGTAKFRPILVRNKDLLIKMLGSLPIAGQVEI